MCEKLFRCSRHGYLGFPIFFKNDRKANQNQEKNFKRIIRIPQNIIKNTSAYQKAPIILKNFKIFTNHKSQNYKIHIVLLAKKYNKF